MRAVYMAMLFLRSAVGSVVIRCLFFSSSAALASSFALRWHSRNVIHSTPRRAVHALEVTVPNAKSTCHHTSLFQHKTSVL